MRKLFLLILIYTSFEIVVFGQFSDSNHFYFVDGHDTIILSRESGNQDLFSIVNIDEIQSNRICFGKYKVFNLEPVKYEKTFIVWNDSLHVFESYFDKDSNMILLDTISISEIKEELYLQNRIPSGGYFTYFQGPQNFSCKKLVVYFMILRSKKYYFTSYDNSSEVLFASILKRVVPSFDIALLNN